MERWTMAVPCLFGLEGLVGDELRRMGMEDVRVEDRRVFFTGGAAELARANIGLRMGERVMILLARFPARSFEELYQGVKAIPLERFVPREGAFPSRATALILSCTPCRTASPSSKRPPSTISARTTA